MTTIRYPLQKEHNVFLVGCFNVQPQIDDQERKKKSHQATQYSSSLPSSFHLVIAASLRAQSLPFRPRLRTWPWRPWRRHGPGPVCWSTRCIASGSPASSLHPAWMGRRGWMVDVGGRFLGVVSRRYAMVCLII